MASTDANRRSDTSTRILDVGERLLQTRGYNGFSYADIARELGITKAGLHYHFASKAALGEALVARYAERFFQALLEIESSGVPPLAELEAYIAVYRSVLEADRMCLCGTLAVEHETLPDPMREALAGFFEQNEAELPADRLLIPLHRLPGLVPIDLDRLRLKELDHLVDVPAGQAQGGEETECHGLAVRHAFEARSGLESMSEGVPQVQHLAVGVVVGVAQADGRFERGAAPDELVVG